MRFWDASGVCLHPMYKLSTAGVFHTDTDPNDNMNQSTEGEWPLFRKVSSSCWRFNIAKNYLVKILLPSATTWLSLTRAGYHSKNFVTAPVLILRSMMLF